MADVNLNPIRIITSVLPIIAILLDTVFEGVYMRTGEEILSNSLSEYSHGNYN